MSATRARKSGKSSPLKVGLIVIGAVGLLVAAFVAWFFMVKGPELVERNHRIECAVRLRQIGSLYMDDVLTNSAQPSAGGVPYVVDMLSGVGATPGSILVCPSDPNARAAQHVSSFAIRDFARYPINAEDTEIPWIAADAGGHHGDGINVLFGDTSVRWMDPDRLGLAAGEEIVVGPASSHPELKKLCIVPAE